MNQKRKILTILLLILSLGIILGLIITPIWWKNGSYSDFISWYPSVGSVIYVSVHYLSYILLTACVLTVLVLNFKKLRKLDFSARSFYVFTFVLLITQFVYCKYYPEFYPAVMMPLFDGGVYSSKVMNTKGEIKVIDFNNKEHIVNTKDLLNDFVGSPPDKDKAAQSFFKQEKPDKSYRDWLEMKLTNLLNIKNIKEIEIIKVEQFYSYETKLHLDNEVRTKIQTIHFQ